MEVYMVNLKVNCCMCMEILSKSPKTGSIYAMSYRNAVLQYKCCMYVP